MIGERPRSTMVQRMSEMLSRWLEESSSSPRRPVRSGQPGVIGSSFSTSASATSTTQSTSVTASASLSTSAAQPVTTEAAQPVTTEAAEPVTTEATSSQVQPDASHEELEEKAGASRTGDSSRKLDLVPKTDSIMQRMSEGMSEDVDTVSQEKAKGVKETLSAMDGAIKKKSGKEMDRRDDDREDKGLSDSRRESQRSSSGREAATTQENEEGAEGWRKGLKSRGGRPDQPAQRFGKGSGEVGKETELHKAAGNTQELEKGSRKQDGQKKEDEEKKGIFAFGERMEDKKPMVRNLKKKNLCIKN